jgi:hypothetical protein
VFAHKRSPDAVAVGYVAADVVSQSSKASAHGVSDAGVQRVAAQTTVFQLLASILTPFAAIHTQVHAFQKLLKNTAAARYGPSAAGLALIPFLPARLASLALGQL